jgi:ATP-dependent RNA helicase DDX19/DBP5
MNYSRMKLTLWLQVHDKRSWQNLMDICKHFNVEPTKLNTDDWDEVERMLKQIMKNSRNVVAPDASMGD